jgi:hypothetical protein
MDPILGSTDRQKLTRIFGGDSTKVDRFMAALKSAIKGKTASERRGLYYTNSPRLQRLGGILKQQSGGRAGGTNTSIGVTELRTNKNGANYQNAAGITEIGGDN